jgi:hypothetical protein
MQIRRQQLQLMLTSQVAAGCCSDTLHAVLRNNNTSRADMGLAGAYQLSLNTEQHDMSLLTGCDCHGHGHAPKGNSWQHVHVASKQPSCSAVHER